VIAASDRIDTSGVVDFLLGAGVASDVEALMSIEGEAAATTRSLGHVEPRVVIVAGGLSSARSV
jgi:hypothetical protein